MTKYIPPAVVQQIIDAMDIQEVVSDYVTLKKKGANYWALSPFGREKSASFSVNASKGIFKCFSSGKGGNSITFLMELEGYTYVEALIHIAKKYNIVLPDESEPDDKVLQMEALGLVLNAAQKHFLENTNTPTFYKFVSERKISKASADKFGLGFAQNEWELLKNTLVNKAYSVEVATSAGLISKSDKNGKYYDTFRNRIMFPIHSGIGKIIGFGGRITEKDVKAAKYINTAETLLYEKSKVLYGLFFAKTAIKRCGYAILTEGYTDVIMCHQYGFENTVANCGTSLTTEQIRLLRRFTKKVVLVYDGDSAGIKAALRSVDIVISEGLDVIVLTLPDKHDPDSYLNEFGAEAFQSMIDTAQTWIDFKIACGFTDAGATEKKDAIEAIAKTIARIDNAIEAQIYTQEVATKTGIDYKLIADLVATESKKNDSVRMDLSFVDICLKNPPYSTLQDIHITEKIIIEFMIRYGKKSIIEKGEVITISQYIYNELNPLTFFNNTYQSMKEAYYANDSPGIDWFVKHENDRIKMAAMELNCIEKSVNSMLKEYDSFDLQNAYHFMVSSAINMYKYEWSEKTALTLIGKVNYKNEVNQYVENILPLLSQINYTKNNILSEIECFL